MIGLVVEVMIGDGRVVNADFRRCLEDLATARDRAEEARLRVMLRDRITKFRNRHNAGRNEEKNGDD